MMAVCTLLFAMICLLDFLVDEVNGLGNERGMFRLDSGTDQLRRQPVEM